MRDHKILFENEKQANRVSAKLMRISFVIFTLIYFLNIIGVFVVKQTTMTIAYVCGGVLLLLPTLLIDILKLDKPYIKYLNVAIAAAFITILSATLTHHVVVLYVYPIAIASLYFSKRLNMLATAMTVVGVSLGQFAAFFLPTQRDDNFPTLNEALLYGIVPRAMVLIAVAAIFTMLSGRTASLLNNLLGAERELRHSHREMVMGFATLVENKDGSTGGHIKRTTSYVKLLAEELRNRGLYAEELTDEYLENLYSAAPMHDIGKIAVPDVILQKPGKLTSDEFEIIKTHTKKGGEIIKETFGHLGNKKYTQIAYDVATFHHEKWNGQGYPDGLKEDEIPLCARIMAIADVFDVVSEKRCYRDAMPLEKCFDIIADGSGQAFEPLLVDVFLDIRQQVTHTHDDINAVKDPALHSAAAC